jgi:hypothetical protein
LPLYVKTRTIAGRYTKTWAGERGDELSDDVAATDFADLIAGSLSLFIVR